MDTTNEIGPIQPVSSDPHPHHAPGGGFTHGKGAALLRMYEHWLGSDAFRSGIREFVVRHAQKSASVEDFFRALDLATGQPVSKQSRWFIQQSGAPRVHLTLKCGSSVQLHVRQSRDRLRASTLPPGNPGVPLCVRYDLRGRSRRSVSRGSPRDDPPIGAETCPKWMYGNPGLKGYYRWSAPQPEFENWILAAIPSMSPLELAVLPEVLLNAYVTGRIEAKAFVGLVNELARTRTPYAVQGLMQMAHRLDRWHAQSPQRDLIGRWTRALNNMYESSDDTSSSTLTPRLQHLMKRGVAFMASDGSKDFTQASASGAEQSDDAYWHGTPADWDRIRAVFAKTSDPLKRMQLATALGSFNRKDCLDKGLALVHDGTIRGGDLHAFVRGVHRRNVHHVLQWLEADGRDVLKTLSPPEQWRLIGSAHHVCTPAGLARVKRILKSLQEGVHGSQHGRRILNNIRRCVEYQKSVGDNLTRELSRIYP